MFIIFDCKNTLFYKTTKQILIVCIFNYSLTSVTYIFPLPSGM